MPRIDVHVHCRDGKQAYKATIKDVTRLAREQFVDAICDMPNTDPPIISEYDINERIKLAQSENCLKGYYLYIGGTKNEGQLKEAARIATNHPNVVGIKIFTTGKGPLAITNEDDQRIVYKTLAKCDYRGILCVHSEKESLFRMDKWNPRRPWTWNWARPSNSEVEAVKDQIDFAKDANFLGTLHIPHVSVEETVEVIDKARNDMFITCGVTPHHLTLTTNSMREKDGVMYIVNPPIREYTLKLKKINWIETDHAPHTLEDKTERFTPGIPSLKNYFSLLKKMKAEWGFSFGQIDELTYYNIKRVFKKIKE